MTIMKKLLEKIRRILRNRRTRRLLARVVSVTAALVVFVTTYALVLPAITMETNALCGIEAHEHTDDCYTEELICGLEESPGHTHDESCYEISQVQVCRTEEHQHDQSCYDDEGNLTCQLEEHEHTDECFEEHKELICDIPESEGHTHTAECYQKTLTCGKEVHIHSTECYEQEETDEPEDVYEMEEYSDDLTIDEDDGLEEDESEDTEADSIDEEQDSEYDLEDGEEIEEDGDTDSDTDDYEDDDSALDDADEMETADAVTGEVSEEDMEFSDDDTEIISEEAGQEDGEEIGEETGEEIKEGTGEEAAEETGAEDEAGKTANVSSEEAGTGTDEAEKAAQKDGESADDVSTDTKDTDAASADTDAAGSTSTDAKAAEQGEDAYVPELDPLYFEAVLNRSTGIYYYHVSEDETIENSSAITDWNKVEEDTELGKSDLLRVYLSYTIPPGSLNETNPTARYRLPENIRLSDAQIEAINKSENGIAAAYSDSEEDYQKYLGMEAVEGGRKPDEKLQDGAQEFISATVRAENIYDEEDKDGGADVHPGQDLIFTFAPYSIEKNRNTYDAEHKIVSAGEEITGWFVCDLNTDQVEWADETIIRETELTEDFSEDLYEGDGEDNPGTTEDISENSGKNQDQAAPEDVSENSGKNLDQAAPEDVSENSRDNQETPEDIREKNEDNQGTPEDIQENSEIIQEGGEDGREEGADYTGTDSDDDQTDRITVTVEKTAEIIFAAENKEEGIKEISSRLKLVEQMEADRETGEDTDSGENNEKDDASVTASEDENSKDNADTEKDAADASSDSAKDNAENTDNTKGSGEEEKQTFKSGRLTADGDGYKITLDYTAEAQIPENAQLSVREITAETDKEAYEQCLAQAKAHVEKDAQEKTEVDTDMTRFFDIEILAAGNGGSDENAAGDEESDENAAGADGKMQKIEPAAPVKVSIQILDTPAVASEQTPQSDPTVLHFAEEGVEQIDAATVTEEADAESGVKGNDSGSGTEGSGKKSGTVSDSSAADADSSEGSDSSQEGSKTTEVQFEAASFSVYGVVYTMDFYAEVISASGDKYEITVKYEADAMIPEGAELRVREILPEDEEYQNLQNKAGEKLTEEISNNIPAHPVLFDISIVKDGTEIEPAEGSSVKVEVKLVKDCVTGTYSDKDSPILINDEPVKPDEQEIARTLKIIHDVKDGGLDVVDVSEKHDEDNVIGEFSTESFSNYLVFLDEDVDEITVGQGDTITLRPYSQWVWNQQNTVNGQTVSWVYPDTGGHMTVQTKSYTDSQLNQTYDFYQLTATANTGDFYIETTAGKRIHVTVAGGTLPDVPGTVEGLDTIKINLFNYDKDHSLDVAANVASWIDADWSGNYYNQGGGREWNRSPYANDGINAGSALKFLGWGSRNGGNPINNYTATAVTTGIVSNTLVNGTGANADKKYPKLEGNGNTNLQYLFSAGNADVDAYMGVTGLFRRDEDGYYYFNSNTNYAVYDGDSNSFILYDHTYSQATTKNNTSGQDENSKPIGFFPFHPYNSEDNLSPNHDADLDHHFGISMEVKFALPPDKKLHKPDGTSSDITFEFSGDDDMWVFVDDNLTLDMGGIHQPLTGNINFTTDSRFQGGQEYTLRIFYLERGGCDSNCSIRFNIPLTKRNFEFEKQDADDNNTFLKDAKFQLFLDAACTKPAVNDTNGDYYYGISDDDGKVSFLSVSVGTYYMKEIEPPQGYRLNETVYLVKLTEDGYTIKALDANGNQVDCDANSGRSGTQIANRRNPELTVTKQWQDAFGQPVNPESSYTAEFKLQRYERHEGDVITPDTSQPCTFRVYRYKENNTPVQVGSDYTFKGGTDVNVNWGYSNGYYNNNYSGIMHYKLDPNENYRNKTNPVVVSLPSSGTANIYIRDENVGTNWGAGVTNITVSGTPYAPEDTIEHVSTDWAADTEFNEQSETTPKVTLPENDSDPWTGKFSNLTTIEKKNGLTYYYKYYIIESDRTPSGGEVIYLDGQGNVIGDPSTLRTDENGAQTVINRTPINIPIEKYWPDFNDDDHTWTATFQLLSRLIDPDTGEPLASWAPVEGKQVEVTGGNPGRASFDDLPAYVIQDGTEYRIQYSVAEIEYIVRKVSDDSIVVQWQDPNYFDPAASIGESYSLHYVQDAGANGSTQNDYNIIVNNTLASRKEKKKINVLLQKLWAGDVDLSNAHADFVLKRTVYEEYRNFDEDTTEWVDITLDTGDGAAQTLRVEKNWPMTIFCHIKANTNAESIRFSDGSGQSGIIEGSYDNSAENSDHLYWVQFTADRTKTVTLAAGAQYVVGGIKGFRLSDINHPTDMEVKADNGFEIPISLDNNNDWQVLLRNLTEIEEAEFEGNPLIITRYVYRYYLEETECSPEDYSATFIDNTGRLFGDIDHKVDYDSDVTAVNLLKPGSLKITKNVTVNNNDPTADTASLADGTYYFTVEGVQGTATANEQRRTVSLVISGGQTNTVEVENLTPGQYLVTELTPTNGTSLVGNNGITAEVEAGKTGAAVSADGIVEMTNNINTTQLTVHKVWTDDGQEGVDHSNDQISYTLYRIPYVIGENDEITEYDPQEVQAATGYMKVLNAVSLPAWTNVITGLPVSGGYTPPGEDTAIPVLYEYYITEGTFQGYKTHISGGSADGVYSFTVNNEPHSSFDKPAEVNVNKVWQKMNGQPDQDGHDNDSITFNLVQTKYRADIYAVNINLINGDGTRSNLSRTIYMPGNQSLNLRPVSQSNGNAHRVNVSGTNADGSYRPGNTVFISNANGGRNLTFTLQKSGDTWGTGSGGSVWNLLVYDESNGGSVSENDYIVNEEDLLSWVLENCQQVDNPHDPFEYTMKLTEGKEGTEVIKHSEHAIGQCEGSETIKWTGGVSDLPFYEKADDGRYYAYTYAVTEVKIDSEPVTELTGDEDFQGQTSLYLVNWEQDSQSGTWTITNRKKPVVSITVKKMDQLDLEEDLPLLAGAAFRLEKYTSAAYQGKDPLWTEQVKSDTAGSGQLSFTELTAGYYQLVETEFPTGYVKTGDNPRFRVREDNNGDLTVVLIDADGNEISNEDSVSVKLDGGTLKVGNTAGAALPSAGGQGTKLITLLGCFLTLLAAGMLISRRRA